MTRETLFHIGVRLLALHSLLSGGARLLAMGIVWLHPASDWVDALSSTLNLMLAQALAELLVGGLLLWQVRNIVRWCGVHEPLQGDADTLTAWSEAALKLLGIVMWARMLLLSPAAYEHWQKMAEEGRLNGNGSTTVNAVIVSQPEILVYAVLGLLLLAGARYLAENVIRRKVAA